MKTRFSPILRSMVIGGLVVTGVAKVLIQLTASPLPDLASGRIEPALFAPAISQDWDYITTWQTWLLVVLSGSVMACFAGWLVAAWLERRADAHEPRPDVRPAATSRQFPARRAFDRQDR